MTFRDELVPGRTTLLLRGLRAKQVTEARRAAHELATGGQLEPLGNGLLGLLHEERSKTENRSTLGKGLFGQAQRRRGGKGSPRYVGPWLQPSRYLRALC